MSSFRNTMASGPINHTGSIWLAEHSTLGMAGLSRAFAADFGYAQKCRLLIYEDDFCRPRKRRTNFGPSFLNASDPALRSASHFWAVLRPACTAMLCNSFLRSVGMRIVNCVCKSFRSWHGQNGLLR
jgi:hypothetical protein